MAKNKLSLDFPAYDHLKKQLEKAGGNALKTAVDKALTESARYADAQLEKAIAPHRKTGRTEDSLEGESRPQWSGTNASIDVGFDISNGGLPSIFLMYGTKVHGQPHVEPDRKLYNAIYGSKVKNTIKQIQEEAFFSIVKEVVK